MTAEQKLKVKNVCATMALEDMPLNAREIETVKGVITGKINADKVIRELVKEYTK